MAVTLLSVVIGLFFALVSLWQENRELSRILANQESIYHELHEKHLAILSDTKKLKSDPEHQERMLKDEFGYMEENQVPVVTIGEDGLPVEREPE